MDMYETVADDLFEMAQYWIARKASFVDAAAREYEWLVDPAIAYKCDPAPNQVVAYNQAFTEWVLFERALRDGMTPLELFAAERPVALESDAYDRLRQVERSQFFSRFAIEHKDTMHCVSVLADTRSGCRYEVLDPHLTEVERWRDGTIAVRIACVDGAWIGVGQLYLYDVAPAGSTGGDGPGAVHPEDLENGFDTRQLCFFLRLVRDVMGVDGRYAHTMKIRYPE